MSIKEYWSGLAKGQYGLTGILKVGRDGELVEWEKFVDLSGVCGLCARAGLGFASADQVI